jgi:hypothetical protein
VPVLVKVSYFPNWQARGAKGPYRVAPNLMVVIPTSHHVVLAYANTPVDWFGDLLGLLGLAALVWLVRAKPVVFSAQRRPLAGPADSAAATTAMGVDDAYVRLHRELAAGMAPSSPDNGGAPPTAHEIDQWLGFPGGLGDVPPAPRHPGRDSAPPGAAPDSEAAPGENGGPRADGPGRPPLNGLPAADANSDDLPAAAVGDTGPSVDEGDREEDTAWLGSGDEEEPPGPMEGSSSMGSRPGDDDGNGPA